MHMTQAPVAALVVALTLVAVLLTSGIAKLRDPRATQDAFTALRVPGLVAPDAAVPALPWVEIALAVLLLVAPAGWLVPVAVAVLLLMLAYTALVARALTFDEPVTCACFGGLGRHEVDPTTFARNVLLTALAGAVVWFALDGGSVPSALGALDGAGWWALAASAAAATVAVLVVGGPAAAVSTAPSDDDLLDYERQATPYGALTLHDGTSTSIAQLAAAQARLLVVLNPGCGPCVRTAENLDDWAARLAPAVGVVAIYPDEASARAAGEHAYDLAAWEPELNVRRVFSVAAPAAILLGADGYLAGGPVDGEDGVAAFVEDVLGALTEQPSPAE
jgi:thiol-disulfide isomerase/thioredoxin